MNLENKGTKNSNNEKLKTLKSYLICLLGTALSSFLIYISFKCFMSPSIDNASVIIAGGTGGLSRTISLIFSMCGSKADLYLIYSIVYFILNVPSIILSFFFGKKYGIFTMLNVATVSLLTNFVDIPFMNDLARNIACVIQVRTTYFEPGLLVRVLVAAILNGSATVIAFSCGSSAGGVDTISYFFAVKKSCGVSKPLLIINSCVITLFSILVLFSVGNNVNGLASALTTLLFAILYQLVLNLVIDGLSKLNKKEQLQIVTEKESVAKIVTANSKHSCTIVKSKGAYSGKPNYIIYTTITVYEVKHMLELIKNEDPNSFIDITTIKQVYGYFVGKYSR